MALTLSKRHHDTRDDAEYAGPSPETVHRQNVASRIIWFIAGVILTLLAFRFVFVLLGANADNAFADFIYDASRPFVQPFFGLFDYTFEGGRARIEAATLVAMAVYAIIAAGLARLVTITRD